MSAAFNNINNDAEDDCKIKFSIFDMEGDLGLGDGVEFNKIRAKESIEEPVKIERVKLEPVNNGPEVVKTIHVTKVVESKKESLTNKGVYKEDLKTFNIHIEDEDIVQETELVNSLTVAARHEERVKKLKSIGVTPTVKSTTFSLSGVDESSEFQIYEEPEILDNIEDIDDKTLDILEESEKKLQRAEAKEKSDAKAKEKEVAKILLNKRTNLDRAGIVADYILTEAVKKPLSILGKLIAFLLAHVWGVVKCIVLSVLAITLVVVFYTNYVNKSISAEHYTMQDYTVIRDVLVKIASDVFSVFKKIKK